MAGAGLGEGGAGQGGEGEDVGGMHFEGVEVVVLVRMEVGGWCCCCLVVRMKGD